MSLFSADVVFMNTANRLARLVHSAMLLAFLVGAPTPGLALDEAVAEPTQRADAPFRLFRTQNWFNLLKLDTRNGKLWQVQFDVKGSQRYVVDLSATPLVDAAGEAAGRFTLHPTVNIYTFILLDQQDGRTWQVQWSLEADKRGVVPIQELSQIASK